MMTCSHLVTPHSLTLTPIYAPVLLHYLPPSIPLDPLPPYHSLFTTALPPDSAEAPQISQITGATLIYGIQMLSQTGTCSSSPPVHPQYLNFYFYFPCSIPHKNMHIRTMKKRLFLQVGQIQYNMCFIFFLNFW